MLFCQFIKELIYVSCYHPLLLKYDGISASTGKRQFIFTGIQGSHTFKPYDYDPRDILIPCRKCIGCRLNYSRRWADRLMLELDHSKTALFLTLTYDDVHATIGSVCETTGDIWYTLVKKDLQDFNKRLRYYFPDKEIRFYSVGEYGTQTLRPHYHGIYYGLCLEDFPDLKFKFFNKHHQPIYTSDKLASIWKNGLVSIGNVSWQSCAYVARYSLKKLAQDNDILCASRGCIDEFSLMSRNKGIGYYFAEEHPEIYDSPRDEIVIVDPHGVKSVKSVPMPKNLFDKLELINPELYAKIKQERRDASQASFLAELSKTDLYEEDYLRLKETIHENKASLLVRNSV